MPRRKGLLAPQNTFLDTIATRFDGTHSNFVLGNAKVSTSYPIVYCSDGFCELTGFARAQIMQKGCACRFLYGQETGEEQRHQIEEALEKCEELKLEVMFYRKNGVAFWCLLDIVPIKNEKREVVLFLASHKHITPTKVAEVDSVHEESNEDDEDSCNIESGVNRLDVEAPPLNYERRRSRAVLYQLSGHYRQDNKPKIKLNNSLLRPGTNTPLPEYKSVSAKRSKFVLSHYGVFKSCWDWLVLVATFYIAVAVPYNASFVHHRNRPSVVSDVLVETLFIVDILLNFRTTYVNKKGEVVSSPASIAANYLRGWFMVDLLAAMPFDLLFAADVYSSETPIHLLKLTRLLRLFRLLQKMERYTQYSSMILALLLLLFSLAAHWLACVWYVIAERERLQHPASWNIGWIPQMAERLQVSVHNITTEMSYITALYFTCTSLTSVGFGNVSANTYAEKIFSVVVMLVGALMHAAVFGNVTAIVQRMYAKRSMYDSKWNDLRDFMALYQVPKELKQRILDYFQTMWSLNHGIEMSEVLRDFPEELRADMCMHVHRELLQLPIFAPASPGCLKMLSLHVKDSFCAPGEYLVHRGDALHCIFYLCNGSMEVVQTDMVVAILGKGDLLGCDIEHLMHDGSEVVVKSSSDVRALTYCDLKCLHINGLISVLRLYEDFQQEFSNDIQHDLTYNLREGYEADTISEADGSVGLSHVLPSISEDNEIDESDDEGVESHVPPCVAATSVPLISLSSPSPSSQVAVVVERNNPHTSDTCIVNANVAMATITAAGQTAAGMQAGVSDPVVTSSPSLRDVTPDPEERCGQQKDSCCSRLHVIQTQVDKAVELLEKLSVRSDSRASHATCTTCQWRAQTEPCVASLRQFVARHRHLILALLAELEASSVVMTTDNTAPSSPARHSSSPQITDC